MSGKGEGERLATNATKPQPALQALLRGAQPCGRMRTFLNNRFCLLHLL